MNRQKQYWIIGILAGIVIILLIFFSFGSTGKKNSGATDPHAAHNGGESMVGDAGMGETSAAAGTSQAENNALSSYMNEQDQIMTDMMESMTVEPSGNASVDFLKGMIPHHESAIDMSESYLKYGGSNSGLKQLAQDIIDAQTGEIEEMNRLISEIEASGEKDEAKEKGYLDAYNQMMSGHAHMHHGTSTAADVETAFAEGMVMHHQMAVDMSRAILDYTDHEEVKKLAETMIDAQEKEITQMENILKNNQ